MYQPGLDLGLAKVRYAEVLEEADNERAAAAKPAARRLVLMLAAAAPIAVYIIWMWAGH